MITDFTNPTTELVKFSLNLLSLQHKFIANNIANANTQGYYAEKIDFQSIYDEMSLRLNETVPMSTVLTELKDDIQKGSHIIQSNVEGVELDNEMIGLSQNTVLYKALLSALSNRGDFMKIALTGSSGK